MARGCYNAHLMAWDERMKDFHARRAKARGMGGPERLARRRAAGALNARERVELDTLPYGAAARHLVHDVIDPADTRDVVIRFLEQSRTRSAIGRHRLAGWPTKF